MPELHTRLLADVIAHRFSVSARPYRRICRPGTVDRPSQDLDAATENPAPMAWAHRLVDRPSQDLDVPALLMQRLSGMLSSSAVTLI
ncbi:hypothetical protein AB0D35_10005 [Streptomyces sp. NPDC048301]|uniref:hypothetical protein n=1 Tax=Streptomyces sp. NPDC048301 TaxID=3155631 RepID=UPI0034308A40